MVLDIGGGSTEVVVGSEGRVEFFVSTQIGSVRYTERFLHTDPPSGAGAGGVPRGGREELAAAVPRTCARSPRDGVAVAGTPTSFAAIDLALEPYDRERVDGHRLSLERCEEILARAGAPAGGRSGAGPRAASRSRADDRRRRNHPRRGDEAVRPNRDGGV